MYTYTLRWNYQILWTFLKTQNIPFTVDIYTRVLDLYVCKVCKGNEVDYYSG